MSESKKKGERLFDKIFHVEVFGKNGSWFSMVMAYNESEAIEKTKECYSVENVKIVNEYDYYIK